MRRSVLLVLSEFKVFSVGEVFARRSCLPLSS
jgi:hypothetical protein